MTNDKTKKVVSVRLSEKAVIELENISKQWDIFSSSITALILVPVTGLDESNQRQWQR